MGDCPCPCFVDSDLAQNTVPGLTRAVVLNLSEAWLPVHVQGLPLLSLELWAKLARAAVGVGVWNVALECTREAGKVGIGWGELMGTGEG